MAKERAFMETSRYRELLIDEVKKYPVLYDTKHEQHRDIDVRDRCWLEISERLGANSETLKREWKILRDSMRQAMKRSKQGARIERRGIKSDIKMDDTEIPSDPDQPQTREPEPWATDQADHDSLELFFASVCQSTKRLPRKHQNLVKRQVLDALLRAEEDFENEGEESKVGVAKNFDMAL